MLFLWPLLIVAAVAATVLMLQDDREMRRMLEERWARGEIDADTYRAHVAMLEARS